MKRKPFFLLLAALFLLLAALQLFVKELPSLFSSAAAFPLEQLGAGLRLLSRQGAFGNGLALALCAGISLLPVLAALRRGNERARLGENIALFVMSAVLFPVLLAMASPARLLSFFPNITDALLPTVKAILGGAVWSVAVLWLLLRLLRLFRSGDADRLMAYLRAVLYALCFLFDGAIALSCGTLLIGELSSAQQSMDGVMAAVRFAATAIPYAFDIAVTRSAILLLDAAASGESEYTVRRADLLTRRCCIALAVSASSAAASNLLQLLCARWLSDVSVSVELPVVSLAFVLLILLAARLVAENRKLRDDNALFI